MREISDQASIMDAAINSHLLLGHSDHKPHPDCFICNFWGLNKLPPTEFENKVIMINQEDIQPVIDEDAAYEYYREQEDLKRDEAIANFTDWRDEPK